MTWLYLDKRIQYIFAKNGFEMPSVHGKTKFLNFAICLKWKSEIQNIEESNS